MKIDEIFAENVFNEDAMKKYLPDSVFNSLRKTIFDGSPLDTVVASAVADGMKEWAIKKGATHFTHWFQPLTGITAEKHDSFISQKDNKLLIEFSGKELIKGESDASSFPSGGLRATFEARGYTAWDPTSYAFIKDGVLCIPTAFCSYGGEALDKKTPLLRSMEALNKSSLKVLKFFGDENIKRVIPTVGAEQEYFLIDKKLHDKREDLVITGRTLFGANPPKGQELGDHYFGAIRPRVAAFMKELDEELWKLGVFAKTEHNEAAPSQHELAPVFTTANISADHNQITMETMKKVAEKHNLVCLLSEKPFAGVNGSGKHNNWSLITNTGVNLFDSGNTPLENARFMLFFSAVIKAVDEYQDLLRISVATAGNDHRLGANEAPPAIISVFVGDDLMEIIKSIENGGKFKKREKREMKLGVDSLPSILLDSTDRNRTSPFAFTGNKFEFRMLGSSASISDCNTVINTIVAEELDNFAEELSSAEDFNERLNEIVKKTLKEHGRIIYNGNNYSIEWFNEAAKRGLLNLPSTDVAVTHLSDEKNIKLFEKHKVFSAAEVVSRRDIMLESYAKCINIEGETAYAMAKKEIYPAILAYIEKLSETVKLKKELDSSISCKSEIALISKLSDINDNISEISDKLSKKINEAKTIKSVEEKAHYYKNSVLSLMNDLRKYADEAEMNIGKSFWPFPTYVDLLFSV